MFGHTHLAKHVRLNGGLYLNSGTWADLMQFPIEILDLPQEQAEAALLDLCRDLEASRLDRWLSFRPTYLRLDIGPNNRVLGAELCEYRIERDSHVQ